MDYAIRVISIAMGLASTISVAFLYAPTKSADYFAAFSAATLLSFILKFGMEDFVVKHYMEPEDRDGYCAKALIVTYLALLRATFFILGIAATGAFFWPESKVLFNLIGTLLTATALAVTSTYGAIYQSQRRFRAAALLGFLVPAVILFVPLSLRMSDSPTVILFSSSAASAAIATLFARREIKVFDFSLTQLPKWINFFKRSSIYFLGGFGTYALTHLPIVMSRAFLEAEFTRDLSLSIRLAQSMLIVIALMNFRFAPVVRALFLEGRREEIWPLYSQYLRYSIFSTIVLSVMFWTIVFTARAWLPISLKEVGSSVDLFVLAIIWLGYSANSCFGPIGTLFIMTDRQKVNVFLTLLTLALLVGTLFGTMSANSEYCSAVAVSVFTLASKIPLAFLVRRAQL
ncbi:hypothetical protein [Pseudothioclava nitratireducens]|uniref:hypothetical protein n=1 Tax=Pseudothioclava nitratireducens TaxID=1928646 RepID=UPI0023DB81EE|nr:hypothetical protein [Defluviimonas nitratireducens]MDF1621705.1 hypothetical protein [Defluviimonas nitratireducens]